MFGVFLVIVFEFFEVEVVWVGLELVVVGVVIIGVSVFDECVLM